MVQGWSTNCEVGVHRNHIVPHQVRAVLQGNVLLAYSVPEFFPFGQAEKGCFQLHNQV
jgi:hypothetical protein